MPKHVRTRRLTMTELDEDERARLRRRAKRLGCTPSKVMEIERAESSEHNSGVVSCRLPIGVKAVYLRRARTGGVSVAEVVRQTLVAAAVSDPA
jgi:hypothetical protein